MAVVVISGERLIVSICGPDLPELTDGQSAALGRWLDQQWAQGMGKPMEIVTLDTMPGVIRWAEDNALRLRVLSTAGTQPGDLKLLKQHVELGYSCRVMLHFPEVADHLSVRHAIDRQRLKFCRVVEVGA